jgi:uncharacterized protein YndB with AHSA1/START domain
MTAPTERAARRPDAATDTPPPGLAPAGGVAAGGIGPNAAKPSLMLRRHIKAPPAKVYAAWTRSEQLEKWFGPAGTTAASADLDVRVGGRFFIRFSTPDGEDHGVGGTYREIVPGERLVFDWAWQSTPERVSLVSLRFARDGEGTMLTLVHEQFFDEKARDGHERGWTGCLDRLVAHFEPETA